MTLSLNLYFLILATSLKEEFQKWHRYTRRQTNTSDCSLLSCSFAVKNIGLKTNTFSQRMSPIVACCWFIVCLILMDFRSLVLVTMRSFQLMKRMDMSCLVSRFDARIDLIKTLAQFLSEILNLGKISNYLINQLEIFNISSLSCKKFFY